MNGFEQIKSFYGWVFNNSEKVRPTHISLYLFLWNQNNRNMWVEWFKCPYDLAMQGACIGNKGTYYRCLDELQEWKLIEYKKGINLTKAPQIRLIQLYDNGTTTEQVTVPLCEPLCEPLTVLLPVPIIKLITDNIELVTGKIETWIAFEKNKINGFEIPLPPKEDYKGLKMDFTNECLTACRIRFENWYRDNYKTHYIYSDTFPLRPISDLIKKIKSKILEQNKVFDESEVPDILEHFLTESIKEKYRKNNFSIELVSKQFNQIYARATKSSTEAAELYEKAMERFK